MSISDEDEAMRCSGMAGTLCDLVMVVAQNLFSLQYETSMLGR